MKLYRIVSFTALAIIIVVIILPLYTLREFPGHLIAWRGFLLIVSPSFFLVGLLILFNHVSQRAFISATVTASICLIVAVMFKLIPFLFFALFMLGLIPLSFASWRLSMPSHQENDHIQM